jgi:hypothetical protein
MLIGSRKPGSEATADRITGEADLIPHFGSKETGIILAAERDECLWTYTEFGINSECEDSAAKMYPLSLWGASCCVTYIYYINI